MDTAAFDMQAPATGRERVKRLGDILLSATFCVLLPIVCWLGVITGVVWAMTGTVMSWPALSLTAAAMSVVLIPIWASLFVSKRR